MANSCDSKSDSSEPSDKDNRVPPLYPVVLGSPETTLDIDSGSLNSDCEEWTQQVAVQNGVAFPQASTINVDNSSDVVIGPLTQFHGPVTIYQNISSDSPSSQGNSGVECKSDIILNSSAKLVVRDGSAEAHSHHPIAKFLAATPYKRLAIYVIVTLAILAAVVISLVISLNISSKNNDIPNYWSTPVEKVNTEKPPVGSHKIFPKARWGGRAPQNVTEPLLHPTEYVVISHTAGRVCKNFNECAELMQLIQAYHVSTLKKSDIGYNFLIGGDGNIYVGRDWDVQNFHRDRNVGISFTGNFVFDYLTPSMISALEELLGLGVRLNKLRSDYKLVCHNQTYATLSPGDHVYREISKLPHFYTGPIDL